LTDDHPGDTGAGPKRTMSTVSRALPVRSRALRRAVSDSTVRVTTLLVVALTHAATVVGDLDERWATPTVLRLALTLLAGLLLGTILGTTTSTSTVPARRTLRLATIVYPAWWSALIVTLAMNNGVDTGPRDLVVPAIFFVGSPGILGSVVGPVALITVATLVMIELSDRRGGRLRTVLAPSAGLRHRHVLGVMVAVGLLTLVRPVTDLLARQHVERASVDSSGVVRRLVGPQLPLFVWVVVTVASVAVLLGTFWLAIGARFLGSRRHSIPTPHLYASAIALAFVVRLFTLLTVAPTRTDGGDPLFYHSTANLLANGLGFPEPLNFIAHQRWMASALHGPLYPLVLSFGSRFGGTTFFDHKMFSLVIGTAVVVFVGLVARQVARPEIRDRVAFVAMLLAAVYPNLWIIDGVLFPEGLMALCTTATVWAAFEWKSAPARRWAIAMGLLTGLAALTRGEGLLLSVLLIVPWILLRRDLPLRRRIAHISWAALACIIVIAPWAIRNERSFEVSVPLSTNGNELFVYANCDVVYSGEFLGFWYFPCQEDLRDRGIDATGDEAEKSLFWREVGFDYARDNIGQLPKVIAARIGRQWELFRPVQNTQFAPIEGRNEQAARAGLIMYYGLAAFSLVGVRQLRRRRVGLIPFASLFISVTLTAAYAYGTTRFRVPAEPALCVLAAVGIFPLLDRLRRRFPSSDRHDDRHTDGPAPDTFGGAPGLVPLGGCDHGRRLHVGLPRARPEGGDRQRRLPPSLRSRVPSFPRRVVRTLRCVSHLRTMVRTGPTPVGDLGPVRSGATVGTSHRGRRRGQFDPVHPHAHRAAGPGVERRTGTRAVVGGVLRSIDAPRMCRPRVPPRESDRGCAGGLGAHVPSRPRRGPRSRWRLLVVETFGAGLGPHVGRRRRWCGLAVGASRPSGSPSGDRRDAHRPRRQPASGS